MKKFKLTSVILIMLIAVKLLAAPLAPDTLVIDGQRNLQLNENTVVTVDRRLIQGNWKAEQGGTGVPSFNFLGYIANLVYGEPGNTGIGNLDLLNFAVGPVTANSANDFSVLFAPVVINENTVVIGADSLSEIALGSIVAVSGEQSENGPIDTSRIEVLDDDFPYWILTGEIASLHATGFNIGAQHIIRTESTTENCGDVVLEDGLKVIVELSPKSDYVSGNDLEATAVFCYNAFTPPPGGPGDLVFFSGVISMVNDAKTQIIVNDVRVNIDGNTQLNGGTIENLVIGAEVEVEGEFDPTTDEVLATYIVFPSESVSASAPVSPEDVTLSEANAANGQVTIMGINVKQNEFTYDADGIFSTGLTEETTVAFFGYRDHQGTIWASTVFKLLGPGQGINGLYLLGTVESIENDAFTILGVNIDTTDGVFLVNRTIVTEEEFLNELSLGDLISINPADSYNATTNTLSGGVFEKLSSSSANHSQTANTTSISGSGTITNVIEDLIFNSTF